MEDRITKVCFVPLGDVLAHTGRMLSIAQALRGKFDGRIEAAGQGAYGKLFSDAGFPFHEIEDPTRKMGFQHLNRFQLRRLGALLRERMDAGRDLVAREVEIFRLMKPDLIVWDGRPTVSISAELVGVPVIAVISAHLTPYGTMTARFPTTLPLFPGLSFVTKLPDHLQGALFKLLWRMVIAFSLKALNRIRTRFDLRPFASVEEYFDSFRAVILPDLEIMSPAEHLPPHFRYVGPLVWQPDMDLPAALRQAHGLVYVTMGSTGNPQLFKVLTDAFARMPGLQVVMTTGDLVEPAKLGPLPGNVTVYPYLPGTELAKRARLVICHGGLGTVYQALSQGVPILGIPHIPAQELAGIDRVEALGAGRKLAERGLTPAAVTQAVQGLLAGEEYRLAAGALAAKIHLEEAPRRAAAAILETLERRRREPGVLERPKPS